MLIIPFAWVARLGIRHRVSEAISSDDNPFAGYPTMVQNAKDK